VVASPSCELCLALALLIPKALSISQYLELILDKSTTEDCAAHTLSTNELHTKQPSSAVSDQQRLV